MSLLVADDTEHQDKEQEVLDWRTEQLARAGLGDELAELAAHERLDVHELEQLVARGCPPVTAYRILRPVEEPVA